MRQLLNTLYVTLPDAYIRLENDTLRIDVREQEDSGELDDGRRKWVKRLQVPLHHVGSVVCFGHVAVSPAVIHRCAEDGKSLVYLATNGRFKARMEGPVSGNILLRQAQHERSSDRAFALEIARATIAGKLRNARQVLLRGARDANDDEDRAALSGVVQQYEASLRNAEHAKDVDTLRGVEGEAAKNYFSVCTRLVRRDQREAFSMDGRSRRPPRDRMNALLSFFYSMLMNDCRSALETVGLDPQLGFLHTVRPGRASLALDLMEEFRAIVADSLALTLVNRGQIKKDDFIEREGGAVQMTDEARKAVIVAYQERKQEELTHPLTDTKVPYGLIPFIQARLMARTIRGEMDGYVPFLLR
jgi:CRISP-associated protein Cas1